MSVRLEDVAAKTASRSRAEDEDEDEDIEEDVGSDPEGEDEGLTIDEIEAFQRAEAYVEEQVDYFYASGEASDDWGTVGGDEDWFAQ